MGWVVVVMRVAAATLLLVAVVPLMLRVVPASARPGARYAAPGAVGVVGAVTLVTVTGLIPYMVLPVADAKRARRRRNELAVPAFWGWRSVQMNELVRIGAVELTGKHSTSYWCSLRDRYGCRVVLLSQDYRRLWSLVKPAATRLNASRPGAVSTRARVHLAIPRLPRWPTRLCLGVVSCLGAGLVTVALAVLLEAYTSFLGM